MSAAELKQTLIASWPPGASERIDWDDAPGHHLDAIASTLQDNAVQPVEDLAGATAIQTAPAWRIKEWERAFGLSATRTALFGTLGARQRQVTSRWREYGAPTKAMIQSVVAPLLGYADVTDLVVLQSDRTDLRTKHTYACGVIPSSGAFSPGNPIDVYFSVRDDAACSPAGAQCDVTLTHGDLTKVSLTLYSPTSSATVAAGDFGRGAASSTELRAYFKSITATSVYGLWRLRVESSSGSGTLEAAELFAEGFGRDAVCNDGLCGASVFQWAVVYEPLKSQGSPDFDAARAAIARITYATRRSGLVFIADASVGLSAGDYGAIPNDNTTPGACVPNS